MGGIARFANRKPETTTAPPSSAISDASAVQATTSTVKIPGLESSFCDSAPSVENDIFGDDSEHFTYDDTDFGFMGGADSSNGNEFGFLHTNTTDEELDDFGAMSEKPKKEVRKIHLPHR
jgi:hypothetical protein